MSSVEAFAYTLFNKLGIPFDKELNNLVEIKQNTPIDIGSGFSWNALYTVVLYFYLDFGIIGIIILPLLFGLLLKLLINKMYNKKSLSLLMLVYFYFQIIFFSVFDYGFTNAFDFIFVIILYYTGIRRYPFKFQRLNFKYLYQQKF